MKKVGFNFSVLLNWIFIVITVLVLVKSDVINKVLNMEAESSGKRIHISKMGKGITSLYINSNMKDVFTKVKGAENLFELPSPRLKSNISIEETLQNRRSRRDFNNNPLNAKEVSQLLWSAYGITKPRISPAYLSGGFKTAPSAGARYPLEIYLVAGNVEGLSPGVYKYIPNGHKVIKVLDGDLRKDLCAGCWYQKMIEEAPVSIVYTAVFSRVTVKYGERGRKRYVCMEVGHSAQNVYLQVEALRLGTCAIGAFEDEEVTKVLKLPNEEEVLYLLPVGHYD